MNRLTSILATTFAVVAIAASTSRGGFDVFEGDFVKLANGNGYPGGIFDVNVLFRGGTSDFYTMCVELTEHVNFNTKYYVDGIGTATVKSGKDLGEQAAWLYTEAHLGTLSGFSFGSAGVDQANALQLGIWLGMSWPLTGTESIQSISGWSESYINDTLTPILNPWLTAFADDLAWSGVGNVRVMTLRKYVYVPSDYVAELGEEVVTLSNDTKILLKDFAQDQLIWTNSPDPNSIVPELPTFYTAGGIVSCAALCGLISHLRTRRRALFASAT
jgi:hypothetical protein